MEVNTIAKQLMFSTVRVTSINPAGQESIGTAFIMDVDPGDGRSAPVLVTNKHVVIGAAGMYFEFTKRGPDGGPILGDTVRVTVPNPTAAWIGHPDPTVDVTLMTLAAIFTRAATPLYYRALPITLFPTPEAARTLDALEDITFVGYPHGHWDTHHKTPIFRRGITATPISLSFGGRPVFLLDGSVFGGSSGSPALVLNEGTYRTAEGLAIGTRVLLVGIIAQTLVRHLELPLNVAAIPHTKLAQELNLGVVFNWSAIDGAIDELFARNGETRPPRPDIAS